MKIIIKKTINKIFSKDFFPLINHKNKKSAMKKETTAPIPNINNPTSSVR